MYVRPNVPWRTSFHALPTLQRATIGSGQKTPAMKNTERAQKTTCVQGHPV